MASRLVASLKNRSLVRGSAARWPVSIRPFHHRHLSTFTSATGQSSRGVWAAGLGAVGLGCTVLIVQRQWESEARCESEAVVAGEGAWTEVSKPPSMDELKVSHTKYDNPTNPTNPTNSTNPTKPTNPTNPANLLTLLTLLTIQN
jgi:hypothetical protein